MSNFSVDSKLHEGRDMYVFLITLISLYPHSPDTLQVFINYLLNEEII